MVTEPPLRVCAPTEIDLLADTTQVTEHGCAAAPKIPRPSRTHTRKALLLCLAYEQPPAQYVGSVPYSYKNQASAVNPGVFMVLILHISFRLVGLSSVKVRRHLGNQGINTGLTILTLARISHSPAPDADDPPFRSDWQGIDDPSSLCKDFGAALGVTVTTYASNFEGRSSNSSIRAPIRWMGTSSTPPA